MNSEKNDFTLNITSDIDPGEDVFETVSDLIPDKHVLHLTSIYATCEPLIDENKIMNCMQVDLFWREMVADSDNKPIARNHHIDKVYFTRVHSREYGDISRCLDGTPMVGDGKTRRLVIRRQVTGNKGPQSNMVVVHGYYH